MTTPVTRARRRAAVPKEGVRRVASAPNSLAVTLDEPAIAIEEELTMSARSERETDNLGRTVQEAVQTIGADIAKTTHDAGEALRKTRNALDATAGHAMHDIQAQSAEAVEGLKQQVREHPMTYIAAAAGIGLLLGFLMHRR